MAGDPDQGRIAFKAPHIQFEATGVPGGLEQGHWKNPYKGIPSNPYKGSAGSSGRARGIEQCADDSEGIVCKWAKAVLVAKLEVRYAPT